MLRWRPYRASTDLESSTYPLLKAESNSRSHLPVVSHLDVPRATAGCSRPRAGQESEGHRLSALRVGCGGSIFRRSRGTEAIRLPGRPPGAERIVRRAARSAIRTHHALRRLTDGVDRIADSGSLSVDGVFTSEAACPGSPGMRRMSLGPMRIPRVACIDFFCGFPCRVFGCPADGGGLGLARAAPPQGGRAGSGELGSS